MTIAYIPPRNNKAKNIKIDDVDNNFQSNDVEGALKELAENNNGSVDLSEYATKIDLISKVDKVEGKGLSTIDFTEEKDTKLNGIEQNANNYVHPKKHSASLITQDETHRFVTDNEKSKWDGFGSQLEQIDSQIKDNTKYIGYKNRNTINAVNLDLLDDRIFSNKFYKISEVFPNVTLSEVQVLNSDATLEDSADWFVIMSLIHNANINGIGYIELPQGIGIISRTIDITKRLYRCDIKGKGCQIKPHTTFIGEAMIKLSTDDGNGVNWATSRLIRLDGLFIDGNFIPGIIGVYIKKAQEWLITNSSIHNCFIGVGIEDSWYGEMSLENVIQNCVRGIETLIGETNEVNTIKFNNVKINCTLDLNNRKLLAIPKTDETDGEYKLRVPTVGARVRTIVGGIEFNGCTMEGQEIGFLSDGRTLEEDGNLGLNGINDGIFSIDNCYLESIKRKFYHIANITPNGLNTKYILNISNTRHFGDTISENSYFDLVNLSVSNCQYVKATLNASQGRTIVVYNDSWEFVNVLTNSQIIYNNNRIATSADANKFNSFGDSNVFPMQHNTYPSIQDSLYIEMMHPNNGMIKNHKMLQLTNLSQLYSPSVYSKCGPVIKGDDNKYYMLQVDVDGNLKPRKLDTIIKVIPQSNAYNTTELWKLRKTMTMPVMWADNEVNVEFQTVDGYDMFYTQNGGSKYPRIMTYEGYLNKSNLGLSVAYGGVYVHLIDLNIKVVNATDQYVDWYGRIHDLLCIGTIDQRPTTVPTEAIGFKYIATDEGKVYEWDMVNKTYKEFTPYNVD